MYQINRMVFGSPDIILIDERTVFRRPIIPGRNILPLSCIIAIFITIIPVILFGIYVPEQFYQLLYQAATLLGRL
jgi:hypothetical protein